MKELVDQGLDADLVFFGAVFFGLMTGCCF